MSVPAGSAIVFVSLLVVFNTAYPALHTRLNDVQDARIEDMVFMEEKREADLEIEEAVYDADENILSVDVYNSGGVEHNVGDFDALSENEHGMVNTTLSSVNDNEDYNILFPDDAGTISFEYENEPAHLTLVDRFGNRYQHDEVLVDE